MEDLQILKVEIDHFRGFREPRIFKLEEGTDLTILSGSNGFGKTSFYDALEWGFTGKLFRYEDPNEEKTKTHFINHKFGAGEKVEKAAEVKIYFGNEQEEYVLKRQADNYENKGSDYGNYRSAVSLKGKDGQEYFEDDAMKKLNEIILKEEWQDRINFADIFSDYHLLTQDKLNYFVSNLKGPRRWEQISNLIGTHRFLNHQNDYQKLLNEINSDLEVIDNEYDDLISERKTYSELIDEQKEQESDNSINLNEYFKVVKNNLKEISKKVSLEYNIPDFNASNDLGFVKDIKEEIIKFKSSVKEKENNAKRRLENLNKLKVDSADYLKKINEFEELKKLVPLLEEKRDLQYIKNNLSEYQDLSIRIKKLKTEKSENKNDCSELEEKKSEIKKDIDNLNEAVLFIINRLNEEDKLSQRISKLIIFLKSRKLPDYQIDKDLLGELENIKKEISSKEKNLVRKKENLSNLKNELTKENVLNDNLHQLLTDSLSFLNGRNIEYDQEVGCPVCDSQFKYKKIISKINDKINSGNEAVTKLRADIQELTDKINEEQEDVKFLEANTLNLFKDLLSDIEKEIDAKNSQAEEITNKINRKISKNKEIDEKIKALDQMNKKISDLISKYKLEDNNIHKNISMRLKKVNEKIDNISINTDKNDIEKLKNNINNLEKNIVVLKDKFDKNNFDTDNLQKNIKEAIKSTDANLNFIEQGLNQIENMLSRIDYKEKELTSNEIKQKLETTEKKIAEVEEQKKNLNQTIAWINKLKNSISSVVADMNNEILTNQEELINKIFKRIYPHPFFRKIKLRTDENSKGNKTIAIECWDSSGNISVNPAFTFSAAQVNIVAISIFLAMALKQQCTRLNTILLDDPIQSMDDLNIISFIDVLRSCSGEDDGLNKQIILSTHEDKFYRLMMKKFRFLSATGFYFYSYDENGPKIKNVDFS